MLRAIDLTVFAGERVAVMGRSGAGKSTLLGLLYARLADRAALIPQAASLVGPLSVFHNVWMGRLDRHSAARNLRVLAWPRPPEVAAVRAVLDDVGLSDKLFARAGTLSGGQQQRASVARALFNGRAVAIGDEPVSALDRTQARAVLARLARGHETLILALHDVALALEACDRVIVIDGGRIALDSLSRDVSAGDVTRFYA